MLAFLRDTIYTLFIREPAENPAYPKGINGTMNIGFGVPTHKDVDIEYERLIKAGRQLLYHREPPLGDIGTLLWRTQREI